MSEVVESGPIVVYQYTVSELRSQLSQYSNARFDSPSEYRTGTKALAVCRSLRGEIEAKRKELKAGALEYGRRVDAVAKELLSVVTEVESPLKELKSAVDAEKERLKREAEEAALRALEEEARKKREAEEAVLRAEREAEEARLAEERRALEEERRAIEEQRAKAAAEQAAAAEAARIEREKAAAEQRAAAEQLAEERRAVEAERARLAREEAERQALAEAVLKAEEERVREAERKAALAARLDALRPDRNKARAYIRTLLSVERPAIGYDSDLCDMLDRVAATLNDCLISLGADE